MHDIIVQPFLKWPGGKRWLIANHSRLLVKESRRYIEPFLGSGAVFFHLCPEGSLLSDSNAELIETYVAIRDYPGVVLKHLRMHQERHCKEHYYATRSKQPRTAATRAARFLYLNRTCFNGLYRVNLKGQFNVPMGTKSSVFLPTDNFFLVSEILANSRIEVRDFETALANAHEGDFVYLDPPYTVKHNVNNFIKYNENIFSWADQVRLAKAARGAAKRGAHVMISNADHASLRELYGDSLWVQLSLPRFSRLASASKFRRSTTELVISNFISDDGQLSDVRS